MRSINSRPPRAPGEAPEGERDPATVAARERREQPIEPLYTEVEAARLLGIKSTWLRAERYAGRISWKKVAGHAMYRRADLVAWQKKGVPVREDAREDGRTAPRRPLRRHDNPADGAASVARALATAQKLIDLSKARRKK